MTRADDSDPPPFIDGDDPTPEQTSDVEHLTPPPVRTEALLQWHARKLTNKLTEIVDRVNHVAAAPRDHEKRIRELEMQRLDITLEAVEQRLQSLESKVTTHIEKTTTTIDDLKAFRWKVMGAVALGGIFTGLITAVLTVLITRNL